MLMPFIRTIGEWIYPHFIWRIPCGERKVALTFDDGPEPGVTERVLDILDRYGMKATFFCLGQKVAKSPWLLDRIITGGHSIGNHSYSHPDGFMTGTRRYLDDIHKASAMIDSRLFRPPYGRIRPKQAAYLSGEYQVVMWDVMSCDYVSDYTDDDCYKIVTKGVTDGSVIVFHDSLQASARLIPVLPRSLDFLKQRGFSCVLL